MKNKEIIQLLMNLPDEATAQVMRQLLYAFMRAYMSAIAGVIMYQNVVHTCMPMINLALLLGNLMQMPETRGTLGQWGMCSKHFDAHPDQKFCYTDPSTNIHVQLMLLYVQKVKLAFAMVNLQLSYILQVQT